MKTKMLIFVPWCLLLWSAECAVLDPALYLFPSPPLTEMSGSIPPGEIWAQPRVERQAEELSVVPIETIRTTRLCQGTRVLPTTPSVELKSPTSPSSSTTTTQPSPSSSSSSTTISPSSTTTERVESMETAETFWPSLHATGFGYGGIHIPVSFIPSGTYGRYGTRGSYASGVIGNSYASVSGGSSGLYGKSGLAGSSYGSYGSYGTRVFGGSNGPSWSGWGNGKWGHYGKG